MTATYVYFVLFALAAVGLVALVHWLDTRDDRRYGRLLDAQPVRRGPNRRR